LICAIGLAATLPGFGAGDDGLSCSLRSAKQAIHHDTRRSREEATGTPKARHLGVVPLIILIDRASIIVIALMQKGAISSWPSNYSDIASPFMKGFPVFNDSKGCFKTHVYWLPLGVKKDGKWRSACIRLSERKLHSFHSRGFANVAVLTWDQWKLVIHLGSSPCEKA